MPGKTIIMIFLYNSIKAFYWYKFCSRCTFLSLFSHGQFSFFGVKHNFWRKLKTKVNNQNEVPFNQLICANEVFIYHPQLNVSIDFTMLNIYASDTDSDLQQNLRSMTFAQRARIGGEPNEVAVK